MFGAIWIETDTLFLSLLAQFCAYYSVFIYFLCYFVKQRLCVVGRDFAYSVSVDVVLYFYEHFGKWFFREEHKGERDPPWEENCSS